MNKKIYMKSCYKENEEIVFVADYVYENESGKKIKIMFNLSMPEDILKITKILEEKSTFSYKEKEKKFFNINEIKEAIRKELDKGFKDPIKELYDLFVLQKKIDEDFLFLEVNKKDYLYFQYKNENIFMEFNLRKRDKKTKIETIYLLNGYDEVTRIETEEFQEITFNIKDYNQYRLKTF